MEVKTTLRVKHIKSFLEDIQKFSNRLSVYKNNTIYGAVAYLRVEEEANKYANKVYLLFEQLETGQYYQ